MEEQILGQDKNQNYEDNGEQDNIFSSNFDSILDQIICKQHKNKVEFACLSSFCIENKFLCPKCYKSHKSHSEYITSLDSYYQMLLEQEQELLNQRKQTVSGRITQMKGVIHKIKKSIDKYEKNELDEIQAHLEEVNLRCKEDKNKFLKEFCEPYYDTTKLFKTPLLKKEMDYSKIQDTALNLLNQIERKEYNIQNLIGFLIRQDNLFDVVEQYEKNSNENSEANQQQINPNNNIQNNNNNQNQNEQHQIEANNQNIMVDLAHSEQSEEIQINNNNNQQFDQDDNEFEDDDEENYEEEFQDLMSNSDGSSELQNDRKITSVTKYNSGVLVFCNENTVYYYDFVNRKIIYSTKFSGSVYISKLIKLNSDKIAVLVNREFIDTQAIHGVITFQVFFEVFILKIQKKGLQKKRIYAEKRGYEIRDIFEVKNSSLIAIVQEESGILILNSINGKVISKYQSDIEFDVPFEGIYSCTMLYNVRHNGVFYKYLIALNLIDGSYGLWDFIGNRYIKRKNFVHNIGLNYKFSSSVRLKNAFNMNNNKLNKHQESGSSDEENSIYDQNMSLIVIQGDRNETYIQRDYDGHIDVKMHHRLIDYFDLFFNQSAIPFYNSNSIFFYDFIQKKRIKTISLNTKFSISAYLQQNQINAHQNQVNQSNNQSNTSSSFQIQQLLQNFNRSQNSDRSISNFQNSSNQNNINNSNTLNVNNMNSSSLAESHKNNIEEVKKREENQQQQLSFNDNNLKWENIDYSQSQSSVSSKQKEIISQIPSQRSSKQKEIKINKPQNITQKQNLSSFSQIWEQSLLQFQQNQTNNASSSPFQYFPQNQQQFQFTSQNERNQNIFQFNQQFNQQTRQVDTLSHLNFGNRMINRNIISQERTPQQQNDILQHNNYKLFDVCPVAIINHFEFVLVIFPNGVIQYIK